MTTTVLNRMVFTFNKKLATGGNISDEKTKDS